MRLDRVAEGLRNCFTADLVRFLQRDPASVHRKMPYTELCLALHGPSMFAVEAKIYGVLYNQASSIAFDETSSYWPALKSS